jgi:hypothetical protein
MDREDARLPHSNASIMFEILFQAIQESSDSSTLTLECLLFFNDRLCSLVVRVLGYRSRGPGSIPGTTRKKK